MPKIAFCITNKGRTQHLRETLPKNIRDNPGISVFVLLDYGSDDGLADYILGNHLADLASGKLVYYRTEAERFKMAHAKNVSHRCGILEGADVLVNLDADNLTGEGFADYVDHLFERTKSDPQEIFLWSRMIKGKMPRGIGGRIAVTRNAFLIAGGYDEKYSTHSPDDKDFLARLRRLYFCAQEVGEQHLLGVTHSDKVRYREYPEAEGNWDSSISPINRVVNDGFVGCGIVWRNFMSRPIEIKPIPTRLFGIGMHKTATRSLHVALTKLGFKSGHWENAHWAKAVWMEIKHLGKSLALERFYAVSDAPIPHLYRELDNAYPNSKFILTIRNEGEWLRSVEKHFDPRFNEFSKEWDTDPFTHRMHRQIYGREKFDREVFLAAYRAHNAAVLEYFRDRPNDLLVMNMSAGAGWPELCGFLDMPVRECNYPTAGETIKLVCEEIVSVEPCYSTP